jgi:phospholipid/cholesterol/gamma-HCH transport system substrate-binding protein
MKLSNETKVGALVVGTILLGGLFAWVVGVQNPFNPTVDVYVTYNFAGGIEVGSPVRVSGIKAGKVEKIEFYVPKDANAVAIKEPGSAPDISTEQAITPLRLKISIRKDAAEGVRQDSRFYVNLAGIIGERYIEVTPGTIQSPKLKSGDLMAGIDPPRIDQLISQSFDLAGKITKLVEENKGDIGKSIELLYKLSGNLNRTLEMVDKSKLFKTDLQVLVQNLIDLTGDVKKLTAKANSPDGQKTIELLHKLIWRLEPLDSKTVRTFLQKEGVKIQMF